MVKYRYAKDESDGIVSAETLRGKNFIGEYTCIGCNKELIAKVNGKIMKPHFAHKADMGCNSETYLHILGKNIFYNTYLECVENNKSFTIELEHEQICSHYKDILANECDIGTKIQKHKRAFRILCQPNRLNIQNAI
ncbi:MAG: competence protein CoiA family protein [Candidatus Sedimenticola sp. (ex Thyasira tokunagai)]